MNPNDVTLIKSAFILLLAGMGMTFVFLIVQIFCTKLSSLVTKNFNNLVPEPEAKVKKPAAKPAAKKDDDADEIVAAIAAVLHHNSR